MIFREFKESESSKICTTDVTKACGLPAHIFNSVRIAFGCRSLLATPVSHFCPASFYWYIRSSARDLLSFYVVGGGGGRK